MENFLINSPEFSITQHEFLIRLLVVLGIGTLIGLERQFTAMKEKSSGFAGIRTFVFVTVLGFLASLCYFILSPAVYLGILISVAILTGVSYWVTAQKGDYGSTTEFSILISFVLGTMAFLGLVELSLMITVLVVLLLSSKFKIHSVVGRINAEELYALIRFGIVTLLVFPFLPDQNFGPYEVLNPKEIGWVIILTSGLGFFGYLLIKFLGGKKGILLSGIVGGLVSSTIVTWVFSKKSREHEALAGSCSVAILAASSIMIIRVLVWIFIFNQSLFFEVYIGFILVFLSGIGITFYLYMKQRDNEIEAPDIPQKKPLDLAGALIFGLIYTAILLVVSYSNENLGQSGIFVSSAIAGLSDIDAISISISKLAGIKLDLSDASTAILIATISNTLVKMGIALYAGSKTLRKDMILAYGTIFTTAFLVLIFFFL
jgi:uncharacterized membrane protein (DUF4010 family)